MMKKEALNRLSGRLSLRLFVEDRAGVVLPIFAIFLAVFLAFGAFALDMSYGYSTRNMLQVTATAAAMAAAPELPDQAAARAAALDYVERNMPAAKHGTVLTEEDIIFGNWNVGSQVWTRNGTPVNAVEVVARRDESNDNTLELFMAPVIGKDSLNIQTSAVAYSAPDTAWDVVLVQDVTGTFIDEIDQAKIAAETLVNCVSNSLVNSRMGLTTFSGPATGPGRPRVVMPRGHSYRRNGNQWPQHHTYSPLDKLSNGSHKQDLLDEITAISIPGWQNIGNHTFGTNISAGIESAVDQLKSYTPDDGIVGQAIVIVSDGQPWAWNWGQAYYKESRFADSCGRNNCSDNELKEMAERAADEAAALGYDIFVLFYDENNDDQQAAYIESLVRGRGKFARTPDADELDEMIFDLCENIRGVELVQ